MPSGSLRRVGREVAGLTIIIAMGLVFGWILTVEQVPQSMAALILGFADQKALVLIAIDVLLLLLGCFVEGPVLLLVMPPILVPALARMGVDPVHFGVVFILAVGIGLYTPPVGWPCTRSSDSRAASSPRWLRRRSRGCFRSWPRCLS